MSDVRVLVDGRALTDRGARGIGGYLWNVLARLAERPGLSMRVLAPPGADVPDGIGVSGISRTRVSVLANLEHELRLPYEIGASGVDVFHSPGLDPPRRSDRPWVQTVHDLTPMIYPHPLFRAELRRLRRVFNRIRAANVLVTNSEYTAHELTSILGVDRRRVRVAPLGVDPSYLPPRRRVEPDPPYLLYVGAWGPHKGYGEAFAVVGDLARRGYTHDLRVVGVLDVWNRLEVQRLVSLSPEPRRIHLLGRVDDARLRSLYHGATALVVSSRKEGFGLPAVEAMASGTPTVAFDNSALREVVGGGGVLVRDGDVSAMANAVTAIIDDEDYRNDVSRRGVAWARRFDWETCAARHAEAYALAADQRRAAAS